MGQENRNNFSLENTGKKNIFSVPEDYFLNLARDIENRTPELNPFLKGSVYKIPNDYFEKLHIAVIQKINQKYFLENSELKKSIFQVNEGYFTLLENKIIQKVPPLKVKKAEKIYTVPEGYFEMLENEILSKIHSKGKVIRYNFRENTVWKYAVAASVTLLIMGSVLFYFLSVPVNNQVAESVIPQEKAEVLIARLEKVAIQQYLEKHENIENQDLVEFSSQQRLARISKDFNKELFPAIIGEKEKQNIELELEDIDISELPIDI